jgi:TRAP-type C4-dicarboxylate transport system permease large subunit
MDLVPTIIVGLLLMILFFISNYRTYINESASVKKEKAEKVDNALKFTQKILWIILVITILVGSSLYYFEKKKEYGSKFNPLKFIFGVKKCKGNTTKGIFF